ncbi:MAG: MFS transporter [Candidatus Aminicenantes bacterium]|nr:MFS transporter [Candidatus Aminicenantes bacterium]
MDKKAQLSASIVAGLAAFLAPFMGSAVNIALPAIGRRFGADPVILGWVATVYLLAAAVFLVPFGRLADIYGRKKIFLIGISLYTISSLLTALAPSILALIGFRVLQGFGAAMIFGTAIAILTSVFPPGERGKALGINTAAVYLGLSLGPVLGGWLTQQFGWRSIFLFNIPLGLIIVVLVLWTLDDEWAEAGGESFDLGGSILYGLALVGIMLGFSRLPHLLGVCLLLAGLALVCGFACWERRTASPILNLNLFRMNRVFAFSNLAALINYSATFAVGFFVSLYLQYVKGMNPQHAGFILISQPAVMALFSPLAGRSSDKIEPRYVASIGMALSSAGLFLLAFLRASSALAFVVGSLALLGFGFALFSSPNTNAVMSSVEKRFYGVASATLGTMRLVGQMFSMGMAMMIFAVLVGRVQITPSNQADFLRAIRTGFMIFAALCFLGVFASLARGNRK